MNRSLPAAIAPLLFVAGCVTTVSHSDSVPAPKPSKASANALAVTVDSYGKLHCEGWYLDITDIPELVRQRHPSLVVIRGFAGSAFSTAVEARDAFKAAGVSNVTIASVDPGAGG